MKGTIEITFTMPLFISVFIGGLIGSYLAEKRWSPKTVQRIFSVIIILAGIKAGYDAISGLME